MRRTTRYWHRHFVRTSPLLARLAADLECAGLLTRWVRATIRDLGRAMG